MFFMFVIKVFSFISLFVNENFGNIGVIVLWVNGF